MAQNDAIVGQSADTSEAFCRVGHYILKETVGVGNFGKVKIADDERSRRRYACKILEKSLIREKSQTTQLQREINCMRRLYHPNTVSFHRVLTTSTKIYIFMEFVSGGELFDEIKRHDGLPEPYARFYFRQLIDGLQHCHKLGVYHRDLKPENLLVDGNGTLKITDFGLSFMKTQNTSTTVTGSTILRTQCGTLNYAAPEIILLGKSYTGYSGERVDVWSCGVILYIMVSGRLPFEDPNTGTLVKMVLRANPPFPATFSDTLKDLIRNLLRRDPSRRLTLEEIRRHPWFNEPVEDHMPGEPPRRIQTNSRHSSYAAHGKTSSRHNYDADYSDSSNFVESTPNSRYIPINEDKSSITQGGGESLKTNANSAGNDTQGSCDSLDQKIEAKYVGDEIECPSAPEDPLLAMSEYDHYDAGSETGTSVYACTESDMNGGAPDGQFAYDDGVLNRRAVNIDDSGPYDSLPGNAHSGPPRQVLDENANNTGTFSSGQSRQRSSLKEISGSELQPPANSVDVKSSDIRSTSGDPQKDTSPLTPRVRFADEYDPPTREHDERAFRGFKQNAHNTLSGTAFGSHSSNIANSAECEGKTNRSTSSTQGMSPATAHSDFSLYENPPTERTFSNASTGEFATSHPVTGNTDHLDENGLFSTDYESNPSTCNHTKSKFRDPSTAKLLSFRERCERLAELTDSLSPYDLRHSRSFPGIDARSESQHVSRETCRLIDNVGIGRPQKLQDIERFQHFEGVSEKADRNSLASIGKCQVWNREGGRWHSASQGFHLRAPPRDHVSNKELLEELAQEVDQHYDDTRSQENVSHCSTTMWDRSLSRKLPSGSISNLKDYKPLNRRLSGESDDGAVKVGSSVSKRDSHVRTLAKSEEALGSSNEHQYRDQTSQGTEVRPGERFSTPTTNSSSDWFSTERDRALWSVEMKDFDTIPDLEEFGEDSTTLSERWQRGLAQENLGPNRFSEYFCGNTFVPSRHSQYLSSRNGSEKSLATDSSVERTYRGILKGRRSRWGESTGRLRHQGDAHKREIPTSRGMPDSNLTLDHELEERAINDGGTVLSRNDPTNQKSAEPHARPFIDVHGEPNRFNGTGSVYQPFSLKPDVGEASSSSVSPELCAFGNNSSTINCNRKTTSGGGIRRCVTFASMASSDDAELLIPPEYTKLENPAVKIDGYTGNSIPCKTDYNHNLSNKSEPFEIDTDTRGRNAANLNVPDSEARYPYSDIQVAPMQAEQGDSKMHDSCANRSSCDIQCGEIEEHQDRTLPTSQSFPEWPSRVNEDGSQKPDPGNNTFQTLHSDQTLSSTDLNKIKQIHHEDKQLSSNALEERSRLLLTSLECDQEVVDTDARNLNGKSDEMPASGNEDGPCSTDDLQPIESGQTSIHDGGTNPYAWDIPAPKDIKLPAHHTIKPMSVLYSHTSLWKQSLAPVPSLPMIRPQRRFETLLNPHQSYEVMRRVLMKSNCKLSGTSTSADKCKIQCRWMTSGVAVLAGICMKRLEKELSVISIRRNGGQKFSNIGEFTTFCSLIHDKFYNKVNQLVGKGIDKVFDEDGILNRCGEAIFEDDEGDANGRRDHEINSSEMETRGERSRWHDSELSDNVNNREQSNHSNGSSSHTTWGRARLGAWLKPVDSWRRIGRSQSHPEGLTRRHALLPRR